MGLKELFRATAARRFERVAADLPEDFEDRELVFVRKLSASERDAFEAGKVRHKSDSKGRLESEIDLRNTRAKLLVRCLCDANGVRLYADEDAEALGNDLPGDLADRLFEQAFAFNGMRTADEKKS